MNNIHIVVNCKPFESIEEAANAEKRINWWDASDDRIAPCVESYAALEIYEHLNIIKEKNALSWNVNVITKEETLGKSSDLFIWVGENSLLDEIKEIHIAAIKADKRLTAPKSSEGFVLCCRQTCGAVHWILDGTGVKGTLYAAYEMLERIGVRWFGDGELDLVIPKATGLESIIIDGLAISDEPKYLTRGVYSEFLDDSDEGMIRWSARARANFIFLDKINNPHLLKKLGIGLVGGGHIMHRDYLNPEALSEDGVRTYGQAHPEWYALVDGERKLDIGIDGVEGYNFCTSNSDAAEEMCKNTVKSLCNGSLSQVDYINFWMLDLGEWCECENCVASGNYSDRTLGLVYRLCKKIRESMNNGELRREVKVLFPVYQETIDPPSKPVPDDFDYEICLPTFFPIERCYLHDIDDPKCTETNAVVMDAFRPWVQDADRYYRGELFLGEYYNVSAFASLPFQFRRVIKHDLPFYYESGIKHLYFFHYPVGKVGPLRLTKYMVYKMLWNPYVDTDKLLAEYFELFYDNAKHIRDVYTNLEKLSENAKYFKQFQYKGKKRRSLNEELQVLDGDVFPLKHMQIDAVDEQQGGISLYQMLEKITECRLNMNRALFDTPVGVVQDRMLEDERRITYLERMTWFLYYFTLAKLKYDKEEIKLAEVYYERAKTYADLLENDDTTLRKTPIFKLFNNTFKASWCSAGFRTLGGLLEKRYL